MGWNFFDRYGQARQSNFAFSVPAMTLIDDYTVSGSAISAYDTFTRLGGNIPQTYKHLMLVFSPRSTVNTVAMDTYIRLNNDSTANYHYMGHYSNAASVSVLSGVSQGSIATGWIPGLGSSTGLFGVGHLTIPDYTNSGNKKTVELSSFNGGSNFATDLRKADIGGGYTAVGATTRISFFGSSGSLDVGSRFTLYGVN